MALDQGDLKAIPGTGETVERGVSVSGEEKAVAQGIEALAGRP